MSIQYEPDVSALPEVKFRPAMIESAWNYCDAVIASGNKLTLVGETLAALAIEIVLKSFSAEVVANEGELNEKYKFVPMTAEQRQRKHDLCALAEALHPQMRRYLFDALDEETLSEHRNTFTEHRYAYEELAPASTSDSAIKLAIKIVCAVVYLYKQRGCDDLFIRFFAVDETYEKHVQPMWYVSL